MSRLGGPVLKEIEHVNVTGEARHEQQIAIWRMGPKGSPAANCVIEHLTAGCACPS